MNRSAAPFLVVTLVRALTIITLTPITATSQTIDLPPQAWRPALSAGIGVASTGSETGTFTSPLVIGVRVGLTPHVATDVEWTSNEHHNDFYDSGPSRLATLNNQIGEYGRYTSRYENSIASQAALTVIGRMTIGHVSPFVGLGLASFQQTTHATGTWVGCTGPWVPHCNTGNFDDVRRESRLVPQWTGGMDFNLTRRVQLYASGRMRYDDGYASTVLGGARFALIPDQPAMPRDLSLTQVGAQGPLARVRTGQPVWVTTTDGFERSGTLLNASTDSLTMREGSTTVTLSLPSVRYVEQPDSITNGTIVGALIGAGFGTVLKGYTNAHALPVSILIAAGAGALLDGLHTDRRLVYSATSATNAPSLPATVTTPTQNEVHMTLLSGGSATGTLISLTDTDVVLTQHGQVLTASLSDVRRIERVRHTVRNFTLAGLGLGFATGFVVCSGGNRCQGGEGALPLEVALFFSGIGAAVGATVGGIVKTNTANAALVYPAQPSRVTLSPILSPLWPKTAGLRVALTLDR